MNGKGIKQRFATLHSSAVHSPAFSSGLDCGPTCQPFLELARTLLKQRCRGIRLVERTSLGEFSRRMVFYLGLIPLLHIAGDDVNALIAQIPLSTPWPVECAATPQARLRCWIFNVSPALSAFSLQPFRTGPNVAKNSDAACLTVERTSQGEFWRRIALLGTHPFLNIAGDGVNALIAQIPLSTPWPVECAATPLGRGVLFLVSATI